jgi:L-histidine N-alpha-methyltransferase
MPSAALPRKASAPATRDLDELRAGLLARPRTLPTRYLYDEAGSALFERITRLPEYYPTRAETALLRARAGEIAARTAAAELVEPGAGSAAKTRLLLDALLAGGTLRRYAPVDVDATMVRRAEAELPRDYPGLAVRGVVADFSEGLPPLPRAGGRLVALLGSTIGNFPGDEGVAVLRGLRAALAPGDRLLLGTDLVKDAAVLHAAYNDAAGVTAAFNLNLLKVVNLRFGADFDPEGFEHLAFWSPRRRRIEMHVVARAAQTVSVGALGLTLRLRPGERIRTEVSCKYTRASVARLLHGAGLALEAWMEADDAAFALSLARPHR